MCLTMLLWSKADAQGLQYTSLLKRRLLAEPGGMTLHCVLSP